MSVKNDRIASNIVKELSYIFNFEVRDADLKNVVVTDCKLSSDLSHCKVYVTFFGNNDSLKALKEASSYIRGLLAKRIDIRHVPALEFVYDESIEYGAKIEKIISDING